MRVFNRELKIGSLILTISIIALIVFEYKSFVKARPLKINIDREQAEAKVNNKFGDSSMVEFERELEKKYYFKVYDKKKKKWVDVYVDKSSTKITTYSH